MAYFNCRVFGVILNEEGKILLIRRNKDYLPDNPEYIGWELPGGGLEHGEDPKDAIARETMEEAGIVVGVEKIYHSRTGTRGGKPLLNIGYICRHISGDVTLTNEHCEHAWVTPEEFAKIEFGPYAKTDVQAYLTTLIENP